jgi:hypothetical protein
MDCMSTRLLLNFVRTGELDRAEQQVVDDHLTGCSDCAAFAQSENRVDDALATAMHRVSVPAGLKGRILARVTSARRPRPWPWVAAATVLLAVGLGCYALLSSGPQEFDIPLFVGRKVDIQTTAEAVDAWLGNELGAEVTAPREFNFNFLESVEISEVQGRKVARLTFLSRGDNRAALAHVYVLSTRQFKLLDETSIRSDTHNIQVRRDPRAPDFFYVVVYTSSLDPFLLPVN